MASSTPGRTQEQSAPLVSAVPQPEHREPSTAPGRTTSGELFAAYQPRIRSYILGMVHDARDADDLTQEVFLQAHRKLDTVRDPDALTSWLYRIATHICYDHFRRSSRRPAVDPRELDSQTALAEGGAEGASLNSVIERSEMSACVRRFLDDLPNDYRQVILLHDMEGLTNAEIAEVLGTSVGAVKIRLHRARGKLRAALAGGCEFARDEQNVFVCESAVTDTQPHHRP